MKVDLAFNDSTDKAYRWRSLGDGESLHRVLLVDDPLDQGLMGIYNLNGITISGKTVCGRRGLLSMPTILSRLSAPRCKACCSKMDIETGEGVPFIFKIEEPSAIEVDK